VSRRNIVLMGFMGTGKTTIGKQLATRLGLAFVDMDHVIEERAGKPIARIFAEEGEPHFRRLERELVLELSTREGLVVGCGGGVVLNPDNITDYARTGLVVCLTATAEIIYERTAQERHRPLLEEKDRFQRIVDLLEKRRALYAAVPNPIDTSTLTPDQIVTRIEALYRTTPHAACRSCGSDSRRWQG
jgi:shikimate kinase